MSSRESLRRRAADRLFRLELRAATQAEAAPDRTREILARAELKDPRRGRATHSATDPHEPSAPGSHHMAAALLVVAAVLVVMVVFLNTDGRGSLGKGTGSPGVPDGSAPQDPVRRGSNEPSSVRTAAEVRSLPASTTSVRGLSLDAEGILALTRLRNLRELDLSLPEQRGDEPPSGLDDAAMEHLGKLSALRTLRLDGQPGGGNTRHLATLHRLESLSLARVTLHPDSLQHLALLKNLQHLDLERCRGLTDAGMRQIVKVSGLRSLRLRMVSGLPSAGLARLGEMPRLERLDLSYANSVGAITLFQGQGDQAGRGVDGKALAGIARSRSLVELNLRGCRNVLDAGVAHLRECGSLQRIDLCLTMTTRHCLDGLPVGLRHLELSDVPTAKQLARFPDLESLGMRWTRVPIRSDAFSALLKTPLKRTLRRLALTSSGKDVDPELPAVLAQFEGIVELDLSDNRWFAGEQLAMLKPLAARLRVLTVNFADKLGDADLDCLARFGALRTLHVTGIPGISDRGLRDLQKALPKLHVECHRAGDADGAGAVGTGR